MRHILGFRGRTCGILHHVENALRAIARAKFGGMFRAAAAIGVHSNTLYRAAAGVGVSPKSRRKIEEAFGGSLEDLRQAADLKVKVS